MSGPGQRGAFSPTERRSTVQAKNLRELRAAVSSGGVESGNIGKSRLSEGLSQEYHFESHGISHMPSLVNKELTWGAGFEKNIEQFIYPSLQILDEPDIEIGGGQKSNSNVQDERISQRRRSSVVDPRSLTNRPSIVNKLSSPKAISFEEEDDLKAMTKKMFEKKLKAAADAPINFRPFKERVLSWKVDMHELPELVKQQATVEESFVGKYNKAEKQLREKIRSDYETSLVEKVKNQRIQEELSSGVALPSNVRRRSMAIGKPTTPTGYQGRNHMFMSGNQIYAKLITDARSRRSRAVSGHTSKNDENFQPSREFLTQDEMIRDIARDLKHHPSVEFESAMGSDHLVDGVLYYRVRNEFSRNENEAELLRHEEIVEEYKKNNASPKATPQSTRLAFKDSSPKSESPCNRSPVSGPNSPNMESTLARKNPAVDLPADASPSLRSSVRRALSSIYMGYDKMEVLHRNTEKDGENGHLQSQLRDAQDKLLYAQLKLRKIPENLFRKGTSYLNMLTLDLSHYSLGDELGLCLGQALMEHQSITNINLRECRLTGRSLVSIIKMFSRKNLRVCDLSYNEMHGPASRALADFFHEEPTVLYSLKMTHCGLRCSDMDLIARGLIAHSNERQKGMMNHQLRELVIDSNRIKGSGAQMISHYLICEACGLDILNLSWNELGLLGAEAIANAVGHVHKKSGKGCHLTELNLSCNNIGDMGAQTMAAALGQNATLQVLLLTHNSVGGRACFIFSKVIMEHPTLKRLDISANPLGEAGARSLFRIILKYRIKCFVVMRNCTFTVEANSFDSTNPANGSPYTLDTSDPYQAALMHELVSTFVVEENNLSFDSVGVREKTAGGGGRGGSKSHGNEVTHHVIAENGQILNKGNKSPWSAPPDAIVTITCSQYKEKPKIQAAVAKETLDLFILIIANAGSEMDRRHWIRLTCLDMWFTTEQAEKIITTFAEKMVQVSLLDIFASIWTRLLDTENKYDFLCRHLGPSARHDLINIMSFEKFKFNWVNSSGHWYLDLGNQRSREVMVDLIALNNFESHFSRVISGRQDTSQKGNWCNFRNETYMNRTNEISIDEDFMKDLPYHGCLEFDYISTTRIFKMNQHVETISYEQKMTLFENLGLSKRSRLPRSKTIIAFLELQVASCKYHFTCMDVIGFMNAFGEEEKTQAKVVVTLFSRISDLENFFLILRELPPKVVDSVASCLGWLNIGHPILPYQNYNLRLTFHDNRLLANILLNLGAAEKGDNIKELKGSEFLLIEAYASLGRLLTDYNPKHLKFSYQHLTEKSPDPRWELRKDLIKHFLIGTAPVHHNIYACIKQYEEMKSENFLTRGPIDLQYKAYLNSEAKHHKDVKRERRETRRAAAAAAAAQTNGAMRTTVGRGRSSITPTRGTIRVVNVDESVPNEKDEDSSVQENESVDGTASIGSLGGQSMG